jgi:hypothetical protein
VALTGKRMPYGLARQLHRIFSEAQAMPELPSSPAYNGFPGVARTCLLTQPAGLIS